jgi:hypothetical protein
MMDPAVKTALALCVLLGGACAALLFHHDRPRPVVPETIADEELLFRYRADAPTSEARLKAARQAPVHRAPPTTVLTALNRHEPPPSLAPNYPEERRPTQSHSGMSMAMMLPITAPADDTTRLHKIVDGDSLAALAYLYLGSADRADEIYEANRDVLRDPNLLPIDVEIKLPPRSRPSMPQTPLVPVR